MSRPLFRDDNTEGYSLDELKALNREAEAALAGLEPGTDEYEQAAKAFTDEVARRPV